MTRDVGLSPVQWGRLPERTARASGQGLHPQIRGELEAQPLPLEFVAKGWSGPVLAQYSLPHCRWSFSPTHANCWFRHTDVTSYSDK